jgi:hypothetical protein
MHREKLKVIQKRETNRDRTGRKIQWERGTEREREKK